MDDAVPAAPPEQPSRVTIVHLPVERGVAHELAGRLWTEPVELVFVGLTRSVVDDIAALDTDLVVVSYVIGTFDLTRLCRDVRASIDCPIAVVGAATSVAVDALDDVVVDALDAGADEVLDARASTRVLQARLRAVGRGRARRVRPAPAITVGDVTIDTDGYLVHIAGEVTRVRPIHFRLLLVLARHAGAIVGPEQLLNEVWGAASDVVDTRRIRIAVSRLRQTLGEGPLRPVIETVASFGYRLTVPGNVSPA